MFPWKVTRDGIQVLELPGEIWVHTSETGTLKFKGRYEIEKCYKMLKDKKRMKLIVKMLKAALQEIEK